MGRASRAKNERRMQRALVVAPAPKPKGGRPRIHADVAARARAYRLRKKAGDNQRVSTSVVEEVSDYEIDTWPTSREHARWLEATAKVLGDEWLDAQIEVGHEFDPSESFGA
jgi:hypothetical protein